APGHNTFAPVQYSGRDNYFAQLDKLWVQAAEREDQLAPFVTFPEAVRGDRLDAKESQSVVGSAFPWLRELPPEELEHVLASNPRLAFQINPTLPDVRQESNPFEVRGVERAVWGKSHNGDLVALAKKLPIAPPKEAPPRATKIVDPSVDMGSSGTYRTL